MRIPASPWSICFCAYLWNIYVASGRAPLPVSGISIASGTSTVNGITSALVTRPVRGTGCGTDPSKVRLTSRTRHFEKGSAVRRSLITSLAALAFVVSAAPALAQTQDKPTEPTPPVTDIGPGAIEITKTGLSVNGKAVEAAPPGAEVTLTLTFRNAGSEALKDVKVTLAGQPESVRLTDAEATLGDLAAGESADGEFAFVLQGECFEFVGIGGEAVYEGGAVPLKVALPATCPGPRLFLTSVMFEGGDDDGIAEPGETLRVFFELVNNGKDAATNVRASVKISGDGLSAAGTDLAWPDIEPGGSARNTSPLILSISSDAKRQKSCESEPQPLPIQEDPGIAVDDKPLPPDTAISSDGTVSSGDANTGGAGSAPGSEPASGGGAPPSSGQTEPGSQGSGGGTVIVEPAPPSVEPQPATNEPEPGTGSGTEPGTIEPEPAPATAEPVPLPEPVEPQPQPDPLPAGEQPVTVQALLTITASGYETATEWSNQNFCAFERGSAVDLPLNAAFGAEDSRDEGAGGGDGATLPVTLALVISTLAALGHRKLVR